jgi:hypothetical protein
MPFYREQYEAAGGDWSIGYYCNRILAEVAATQTDVVAANAFGQSKAAWRCAVLRQCLAYRVTDLVEGAMSAWGEWKWLGALVIGRAAIETVALIHSIEDRIRKHLDAKQIQELDEFVTTQIHAAKASDYLLDEKFLASNIMNAVDRLDKTVPALRQYYDLLSEYAHPNSKGHYLFYGKLDEKRDAVEFSSGMTGARGTVRHVTSACLGIIIAQVSLETIDKMISEIAGI